MQIASFVLRITWTYVVLLCKAAGQKCFAEYPEAGASLLMPWYQGFNWCNKSVKEWNAWMKQYRARQYEPDELAAKIVSGAPIWNFPAITVNPLSSGTPFPMEVVTNLEILRISNIDQKPQNFKAHFILSLTWLDCRVLHNCSQLTIDESDPFYNSFWRPRYRMKHVDTTPTRERKHELIDIHPDGWITYTEERSISFSCAYDFHDMPFDVQECGFSFYLPGMTAEEFVWKPLNIVGNHLSAPEWVVSQPEEWEQTLEVIKIGVFNTPVNLLTYKFKFTRRAGYLVWNYVIPSVWIYLVSWVGLFVDPAAVPARAAIAVIPVLIMINKQTSLAETLPPTSTFTRLNSFIQATLAFVSVHMFEFGFVEFTRMLRSQRKGVDVDTEGNRVMKFFLVRSIWCDYSWRVTSLFLYVVVCIVVFNL